MKVMILTADSNGGYPVPAVRGGAVSTLVEHLVAGNNEKQLCDMEIVSFYDADAEKKAEMDYPNIKFTWIKVPGFLKLLDKCTFNFIRLVKKNEKAISFRSPFSLIYYILRAKKITNKKDADKIVIENNVPLARVMKGSKFKGDWYYHFHNVPRIDAGCRKEFQNVKKFLCVSQFVADQITREDSAIGQIDSEKTAVLLNCVDTDLFRPIDKGDQNIQKIKDKYGLYDNDYVVVFAGRLSEEKGVDVFLNVIKELPVQVKGLVVGSLFSGFDVDTEYHKKLIEISSNLNDRVHFTGYVNHKEMPYMYNVADIAILPSIWDEPAGLTMVESLACKTPVITTISGGIPEYLGGVSLLVARDKDIVKSIRESVIKLMKNEGYAKQCASLAMERAVQLSSKNYIEMFMKLLL